MSSASQTGCILHNPVQLDKPSIRVESKPAHKRQHKDVHAQFPGLLYAVLYQRRCIALALVFWMHGDVVQHCRYGTVSKSGTD